MIALAAKSVIGLARHYNQLVGRQSLCLLLTGDMAASRHEARRYNLQYQLSLALHRHIASSVSTLYL